MGCCFTDAACCLLSLRGLGKGSCCMQGGISLGGLGNVAMCGLEGFSLCRLGRCFCGGVGSFSWDCKEREGHGGELG